MKKRNRKDTISVRMPTELLDKLDDEVEEKKFIDRSKAIVKRVEDSYDLDNLMEIAKDPERQKEINEKIESMMASKSIEKTLETMSIKERNALIFYAKILNDKAITQTAFR